MPMSLSISLLNKIGLKAAAQDLEMVLLATCFVSAEAEAFLNPTTGIVEKRGRGVKKSSL